MYGKRSGAVSHDIPFKKSFETVCEDTVDGRMGTVSFQERREGSQKTVGLRFPVHFPDNVGLVPSVAFRQFSA